MDSSHHVVSLSPTISNKVLSALQPLFDTLLAVPGQHDTAVATTVILHKIKPLSFSERIFVQIPRCCLSAESFRRIRSPRWLKDDLLTVFTNITNFALHVDNTGKYLCVNTQQTTVFLQEPFAAIINDSNLVKSFRTGNFSQNENRIVEILTDWFSSTRIGILTSSLSRPIEDIPTCVIFLDFISDSHYIVHHVTLVNHKNTWIDGVVISYDHLFVGEDGHHIASDHVSIRRCLIAKFFGMFFTQQSYHRNNLICPPNCIFNSDGMSY